MHVSFIIPRNCVQKAKMVSTKAGWQRPLLMLYRNMVACYPLRTWSSITVHLMSLSVPRIVGLMFGKCHPMDKASPHCLH